MARPQKSGLDYFSLDVALDSKFELIEAEFGLTGFAVVVKLLQYIYGGQGYYCEWTNEVALLFSRKQGFLDGGNVVSEIVSASIRRGMFDSDLYDKYRVLTSKGIQKRYFEAVSRRKEIEVRKDILLVNVAQICQNVNINEVNVNINPENVYINPQSKVKESKVKKRKEPTPLPPQGGWRDVTASPKLLKALGEFEEMRKQKKKPMTDRARQILFEKLCGLSGDQITQIKIVEQSVEHCWDSVYPLKADDRISKSLDDAFDIGEIEAVMRRNAGL